MVANACAAYAPNPIALYAFQLGELAVLQLGYEQLKMASPIS
jgi:hypothetical protein